MDTTQKGFSAKQCRLSLSSTLIVPLCFISLVSGQSGSLRSTLIQIKINEPGELKTLYVQDLDIWQYRAQKAQILVNAEEMRTLAALGYEWSVLNEDVRAKYRTKAMAKATQPGYRLRSNSRRGVDPNAPPQTAPPSPPEGEWGYHSYDYIITNLRALESSGIAHMTTIGSSVEGREIWAIKISDNPTADEDEPDSLVVSGVHAREWLTHEVTFHLAKHLVEQYDHDSEVRHIVDNSQIWIVPAVNPDGYIYTQTTDRFWRKNRRDNGDGTIGVDLNRNFDYAWNRGGGAPFSTSSINYPGASPFSEPEIQALRDLVQIRNFDVYLDYHSFGTMVMYPWAFYLTPAPDALLLDTIGTRMGNLIQDVHGARYQVGQISALQGGSIGGSAGDWVYTELGTPGIAFELPGPGFDPPASQVKPVVEENIPAALYFLSWAVGFGDVENVTSGQRYRQILPAITDANDGDEIVVGPGIYPENLTIADKHLVITSIDPFDPCVVADTVIQGDSRNGVVTLAGRHSSSTELAGLTLIDGTLDVFNRGASPTLQNCTILGSDAVAVRFHHGIEPTFVDSTILGELTEVKHPALAALWALDETEGSVAFDRFTKNHGKTAGDPVWQPEAGVVGGALLLDGVDDRIQIPQILRPDREFSVYLWIKGGAPGQVLLSQDGRSSWLLLDAETGTLKTEINLGGRGTGPSLTSSALVTDDAWHHVGFLWDGSERRLYLDGEVIAADMPLSGLRHSWNDLHLGCGKDLEPGSFWSGLIDDVQVYNKAVAP